MKFELLPDKKQAQDLEPGDHIIVENQLWRVSRTARSMGNPSRMLQLAYHTHLAPKSWKFHPVRDEEHFDVFVNID